MPIQTAPSAAGPSATGTFPGPFILVPAQIGQPTKEKPALWVEISQAWAWPFVIFLLAVIFHRRISVMLDKLPSMITKIKGPGGLEIELTPEAARAIRTVLGDSFDELIKKADQEYKRASQIHQLYERLETVIVTTLIEVMQQHQADLTAQKPQMTWDHMAELRGTIHVPDVVFEDYLYQLTDYFPRRKDGRAGRRFSQRYGIIGQAWRLSETLGTGNAIPTNLTPDQRKRLLVKEWGMFKGEADPASNDRGRPAYLCIVLEVQQQPQALLFIDSSTENAFGQDALALQIAEGIQAHAVTTELANAIGEAMRSLREGGPFLSIATD